MGKGVSSVQKQAEPVFYVHENGKYIPAQPVILKSKMYGDSPYTCQPCREALRIVRERDI